MPLVPVLTALIVAIAYFALGALSGALSHVETAAWTVWLASGLVFGLLLACTKRRCARTRRQHHAAAGRRRP